MPDNFSGDILDRYPQPLAATYARFVDQREEAAQHNLLLALFEALLKYAGAAATAQYLLLGGADEAINATLARLARPSLGHWAGLLRGLLDWRRKRDLPDADFVFPELAALYHRPAPELSAGAALLRRIKGSGDTRVSLRQLIDAMVEYRNSQAHGAGHDSSHFSVFVPLLQDALEELLLAVPSLDRRNLSYVESISIERGSSQVLNTLRLMSDRPRMRSLRETLGPDEPRPEPEQVHLGQPGLLSLHPLVVFIKACESCGSSQVGILNGLDKQAAEYLCYGCGHTNNARDLAADVSGFLPSPAPLLVAPAEEIAPVTNRPIAHNLPTERTEFIGRERETEAVIALLRRPAVHLVTLTGPGGSGKTRLALHVAMQLMGDYDDGIWFVDLAAVSSAEVVVQAITAALGVREEPGQPLLARLKAALADKEMLLVLDNFEQVLSAASILTDLLSGANGLKLLVTSRMALHLYGEKVFAVEPLEVPGYDPPPPLEQLRQFAAVRLFVERAQSARGDFELSEESGPAVAEICARLDGLPLAIELAAARVTVYSPHELLARLGESLKLLTRGSRDLPPRQQTLLATMQWSYELLKSDERELFQQLSVFVGGCTLEAIESICCLDIAADRDILDLVQSLVDASLLRHEARRTQGRFRMLETIREYALQQLASSTVETQVRMKHSDFFTKLALQAEPMLNGPDQQTWLDTLEAEDGNLRASMQGLIGLRQADSTVLGVRTASALYRYWMTHGHLEEGRRTLEGALVALERSAAADLPPDVGLVRARALTGLGNLARGQADYARAEDYLSRALSEYKAAGDRAGEAVVLTGLGIVFTQSGNVADARARHEDALAIYQQLGDKLGASHSLMNMAVAARNQGDYKSARELVGRSLTLSRQDDDKRRISNCLNLLGTIDLAEGELGMAASDFKESLPLKRELKDLRGTAYSLEGFSCLAAITGWGEQAARLFGGAQRIRSEVGAPLSPMEAEFYEQYFSQAREDTGIAAWEAAQRQGRRAPSDAIIDEALQLAEELVSTPTI